MDLSWLSAREIAALTTSRSISAHEIAEYFIERISTADPGINAFVTNAGERAIADAKRLDELSSAARRDKPLFGVPVSVKDHIAVAGIRNTSGSKVYEHYVPEVDSLYASRLREAGALIIGKTNLPEFGLFWRSVNNICDETTNPWDRQRTSGGSSGGSAAAVAAGMGPLSLGSDRGGSTRIPAAFCGVFGMVASRGRIPQDGGAQRSVFFASGVGPIAREVADAAILLEVLAAPFAGDPGCMLSDPPHYLDTLENVARDVKAVWWIDLDVEKLGLDPRVLDVAHRAALSLGEAGVAVKEAPGYVGFHDYRDTFFTVSGGDRSGATGFDFLRDEQARLLLSEHTLSTLDHDISLANFMDALRRRQELVHKFASVLRDYQVILTPTVSVVAPDTTDPLSGERVPPVINGLTFPVNLAGLTAATVPCGFVDGLPVGLQVIGTRGDESLVLGVSRAFERIRPWIEQKPPSL